MRAPWWAVGVRATPTAQVCRDAQDAKRDIQVAVSPSLVTTAYCAPAALRPCRFATPSHARRWLRSTPANGLTACRMRLHTPSAGLGPLGPAPLRPYARAYAYRGLRAFASLSMARSARTDRLLKKPPRRPPSSSLGSWSGPGAHSRRRSRSRSSASQATWCLAILSRLQAEASGELRAVSPSEPRLAEAADGLRPAEDLFDSLAKPVARCVARVARAALRHQAFSAVRILRC